MKKPEDLIELLAALSRENPRSTVVTTHHSSATVYIGNNQMVLSADECRLLLESEDTVDRFADTLPGRSEKANLEIHDLVLSEEAESALERRFSTVDDI